MRRILWSLGSVWNRVNRKKDRRQAGPDDRFNKSQIHRAKPRPHQRQEETVGPKNKGRTDQVLHQYRPGGCDHEKSQQWQFERIGHGFSLLQGFRPERSAARTVACVMTGLRRYSKTRTMRILDQIRAETLIKRQSSQEKRCTDESVMPHGMRSGIYVGQAHDSYRCNQQKEQPDENEADPARDIQALPRSSRYFAMANAETRFSKA